MNTHKERPILFSGPMIRAILAGAKTQTRRAIKPQPPEAPDGYYFDAYNGGPNWNFWTPDHRMANNISGPMRDSCQWACPYGKPGDRRLWVRETACYQLCDRKKEKVIAYRADGVELPDSHVWTPSIYMPRWASRLTLEIVGVRAERLQEISAADARAEGIEATELGWRDYLNSGSEVLTGRNSFQTLWDSINAKRGFGWNVNPRVWVIEFKRL